MQKILAHFKANKVLWLSGAGILLTLVILLVVILAMAGGTDTPKPEQTPAGNETTAESMLSFAESDLYKLQKDESAKRFTMTLENKTEVLYLYELVVVKDGVAWQLSTDVEATANSIVASKTVGPKEGENVYYILCTDEKGKVEIYTLNIYRKHLYQVTFEDVEEVQDVQEGDMAALPSVKPQKEGYTFISWNYNFTTPVTADVSVKANWKANTYTITYDANGGFLSTQTQTVTFGSEVTLAIPTRSGYDFVGWQNGNDSFEDGIWQVAKDIRLTAIWDYSAFTVNLDAAGGTLEEESVKVRYGVAYNLPIPVREGYVFLGWYNGNEKLENEGTWNRMAGLSLVAKWEISNIESITFTMLANGGSIYPMTQQLPVGAELPVPVREGYTFGGWFADDTLTVSVTEITSELLAQYGSQMRLYAWWLEEGKPGEFIYELSGIYCLVTGYTNAGENDPKPTIPAYIGGREVKVNIKPPANPNAGITVSPEIHLTVGDASIIYATFIPAYIEDSTKLYFSTNSDCIVLGEDGSFTALKPGVAVVTIRNEDASFTATCTLTIIGKENANPGITITQPEITLEEGKTTNAVVMFVPDRDGDSTELIYTVEGDCIVVENGVITALKAGTATITVTNVDGKYSGTMTVTVTARVANPNAGITIENAEIEIGAGEKGKIQASVIPAFPEDSVELQFATDSDCIRLGKDGSFTAIKRGVATVSITTSAGLTATAVITVTEIENENPGITAEEENITLEEGEGGQINATVVPLYPSDNTELLYFTESDCIELHDDGSFVALKAGTAIVTLTTSEGLSTTVTVTVTKKPDPIPNPNPGLTLISAPEATITVGKSIVLMYSFIPDFDGDDLSVHATADKDDVVQIFEGSTITVKALAAGKVTLTLSAANGKYTATAIINVVEASE